MGHRGRVPEGCEGRSQAGPKSRQLVLYIFQFFLMQAALQHTYIQCSIRLSSHDGAPPRPKTYKLLQDGCGATCLQREKDCQEEPGHRLRESGRNSLTCAAGLVDFPPATHPYIHRDPGGDKTVMMGQDFHFKEEAHSFQNG